MQDISERFKNLADDICDEEDIKRRGPPEGVVATEHRLGEEHEEWNLRHKLNLILGGVDNYYYRLEAIEEDIKGIQKSLTNLCLDLHSADISYKAHRKALELRMQRELLAKVPNIRHLILFFIALFTFLTVTTVLL